MYRCPRCTVELSPDARFCPRCGFNQTNARMQKVTPPQAAQAATSNSPAAAAPAPAIPSINAGLSTVLPPTTVTSPPVQQRSFQPEVKRVIPPRASLHKQSAPSVVPARPHPYDQQGFPQVQVANQQNVPILPVPEDIRQQENKVAPPAGSILPIRTNTLPGPGKNAPATPPPQSEQATPQLAQLPATCATPAHLMALNVEERAYKSRPYIEQPHPHIEPSVLHADQLRSHIGERTGGTELEGGQLQTDGDAAKAKGLSLTKRYMSEQETTHRAAFPLNGTPGSPSEVPVRPTLPEGRVWSQSEVTPRYPDMQRGMERAATTVYPPETLLGFETFTGEGAESLIATSKAAEHWHQSWRSRQRAEAGPAIGIMRGQAAVPEPLMSMQHSIARMRAVIIPKNTDDQPGKNFVFWFTLVLLICIIGGLSAYVISTYAPSTQLAAQISAAGNVSPTLTMQNSHTNTIAAGQTLHVHGMYFGANHKITFFLATTSLSAGPVQSNSKGTFDASLSVPATWLAGSYALQAQDNQSGLHAFLDLQILPGKLTMSNNTPLVLTTNEQPIATTGLVFKTIMGTSTSVSQRITLTNSGNTPVQWSVSTIAENNLNWLVINDGKTGGTLAISGTDSVGISVSTIGLESSTKPYIGSVIFTVNATQAIIPVSLTVQDTALEVVVDPNPVIAYLQGGGTCQPVTLTLINLSNQVVTWNANPYAVDKSHIHLDGQTTEQGTLDPVGLPNNTKVVQITCIGAQVGEKLYHISVYYNGVAVNVPVSVRYS